MAVAYFAGRAIDQRGPPVNALAFVAGCLLATDPLSVADPAFILTFGATLAILVVMPVAIATFDARLAENPERNGLSARAAVSVLIAVTRAIAAMFAASVAAEAILFPVSALLFGRVTFAGLALNFLAIPLMGVAQIAGMMVVAVALVSARLAQVPGWIAHLGAAGLVRSADLVRFAPFLTYRVAAPNWPWVVAYYLALTTAWALWRHRRQIAGSSETTVTRRVRRGAAVVAGCAAVWMLAEPWTAAVARGDGRLHVTFIDVGQGDAAFVRLPRGATLLVDAGGLSPSAAFDIGDRVVAPVLREAGVRRLDLAALSHGDPDHIGGAASIIREFRPRRVWEGIPVPRFEPLRALRDQVRQLGLEWSTVKAGDRGVIDGVEVVVWHPPVADWERQKVRNDDSIVIELRWRDVSVLFTGDIGKAVEKSLAAAISRSALRVMKVPHHGSLTSSTPDFVRAIAPRLVVVSAGRANHFGHPAPDVLTRYHDAGAEIFRTDRDGAVTVDSDGYSLDIHTFTGKHQWVFVSPTNHEDTKSKKDTKGNKDTKR
jgi:competence protein ComEC